MKVLSPLGTTPDIVKPLAKRRASLAGLRIGILDNSKPNADVLLHQVAEALAAGAAGATVQSWTKPGSSHPSAKIEEIAASVDVLLTGTAD